MGENILNPVPPFVWPEPRIITEQLSYGHHVPFYPLLDEAEIIFGIVYDLQKDGIDWLNNILQDKKNLKCKLIVVLYPACLTTKLNLKHIQNLDNTFVERLSIRILLTKLRLGGLSNILCFYTKDEKVFFVNGPTPNLFLAQPVTGQANFVFQGDQKLLSAWKNWFDYTYVSSVPLTHETINIPALIPATGTPEVAEMWHQYEEKCRESKLRRAEQKAEKVDVAEVDEKTGEVTVKGADGIVKKTPSAELDIPRFEPLAEKISLLYGKGELAAFDKLSRIKPLDAPVKAEWFGVESLRKEGSISREVKYRISVLDEKTLRMLENKRKSGSRLLEQLSFPLGDGMRWIPLKAKPFLQQEINRINDEGHKQIVSTLNGDVNKFINSQRDRIIKDANRMYREFYPGENLSNDVINIILSDLGERLEKAVGGKFLPGVSYSGVSFLVTKVSELVSQWGQPLLLLKNIAEFPRKCITDSYFLRGLRINHDTLMDVMNVCDDAIVSASREKNVHERARGELDKLEQIMHAKIDNRSKCECIMSLMAGSVTSFETEN